MIIIGVRQGDDKSLGQFPLKTDAPMQILRNCIGVFLEFDNQMKANGKVEMCGMNKGTWIRVKGVVKEDTRREARVAMMEENKKSLQSMYTVDDNLMTVFAFESGSATVYSFTEEPKVINL